MLYELRFYESRVEPNQKAKQILYPTAIAMAKKQKFPYLLDSKWTAKTKMWGWRHFRVINRKNEGKWVFAEMVAACDPEVKFWVNARSLKDPSQWQAGWQTLEEIRANEPPELDIDLDYIPGVTEAINAEGVK